MSNTFIPPLPEEYQYLHPYYRESCTLDEAVKKYKLSKSYILKLISSKYIYASDLSRHDKNLPIVINEQGCNRLRVLSENPEYRDKVLDFNPSYFYDYCPELIEYHTFHDFLDRVCWLIKLFYSEKNDIKNKNYRIDLLFENYLIKNKISNEKIIKKLNGKFNGEKVLFHLKKGWYNEMVRSLPLDAEYLNIGTKIKGKIQDATSVSWNIAQTYYSIYEYVNSIDFCTTERLDTVKHRKPSKYFNNNVIDRLKNVAMAYPFTLSSEKNLGIKYPKHSKFQYASYPRDRSKSIKDVTNDVLNTLKKIQTRQGCRVSMIDFMYEFRVWANYTGIETIIKLENGFLLDYLYKNLAIINFFIAGSGELCALNMIGEKAYLAALSEFSEKYILKQPQYTKNIYLIPIFIRHRIYKHLSFIKNEIPFLIPESNDPIKFVNLTGDNSQDIKKSNEKIEKIFFQLNKLSLSDIAMIIEKDWGRVHISAKEYLNAMHKIKSVNDNYGLDTGASVVAYFLANAKGWSGERAKIVKLHLRKLIEDYYKK